MQQHGGHDVYLVKKLIEDYSVTTNFMGPSDVGLSYIGENLDSINHYPPTDKNYFKKGLEFLDTTSEHVMWGNGASELIDLVIRFFSKSYRTFTKGEDTQFMEYERSCVNNNLMYVPDRADVLIIINPNNPTGKFMNEGELMNMIDSKLNQNGLLIIDESMLFWLDDWLEHSMMKYNNAKYLLKIKNINLIVVQSWTKIFSCTGLRFGSIWSPDTFLIRKLEELQNPWSVNILAYHYLNGCLEDTDYLKETRTKTKILRKSIEDKVMELFPFATIHGEKFLSWLWIDIKSEEMVNKIYKRLFENGITIRRGKIGYNRNTFFRLAVRSEDKNKILFKFLTEIRDEIFKPSYSFPLDRKIIYGLVNIDQSYLLQHEQFIQDRKNNLKNYLENNDYFILPSIIVCSKTLTILDGHHRFEIYKERNIREIPALLINYDNENIITHPFNPISKSDVVSMALQKLYLPPKTTRHIIKDLENIERPLISLSTLVQLSS